MSAIHPHLNLPIGFAMRDQDSTIEGEVRTAAHGNHFLGNDQMESDDGLDESPRLREVT